MNNWIIQSKRSLAEVGFPRFMTVSGCNQALSNINSQHGNSLVMKSIRLKWSCMCTQHQRDLHLLRRGVNFIDTAEMYPVPNFDPKWCPGQANCQATTWDA